MASILGTAFAAIAIMAPHLGLATSDARWWWPLLGLFIGHTGTYWAGVLSTIRSEKEQ
ncbi:MAG TPA: hypothetical protein VFM18_17895 [Methanosarcina sp.]|nr:hypothetical protein [Methanosarcina sp.]